MRPFRRVLLISLISCAMPGLRGGTARAQASYNIIFHANLDEHTGYNDVWGYTAPNGAEYALLGTTTGLAVINVSDPGQPYETGFLPGAFSIWRDIKTYDHYAYVTNESSGGLAIVDLADPENPVQRASYRGFDSAHNLFIDEATARCYIAGSNLAGGGVRVLGLADPEAPVEIGSWEGSYVHDVVVLQDRAYASAILLGKLFLLDVSDPGAIPSPVASIGSYAFAFTHNSWMTADNRFVMTTDEKPGAFCRLWDVSDPFDITQTDVYRPNSSASPHNTHIEGNLAFISHYTLGVRVVDISDPLDIRELAFYDTYPSSDGGTFRGCWGVFPFFGTSPDLIVASDIETGLYVLEYKGPLGTLAGEVTRAGDPGTKIPGAGVEVLQSGIRALTDDAGRYTLRDTGGTVDVRASAFGYEPQTTPVTIVVGVTTTFDFSLVQLPHGTFSGTVLDSRTAQPIPGAVVDVLGTPLRAVTDPLGGYEHAAVPAGPYTIRVTAFGYNVTEAEVTVESGREAFLDFPLNPAPVAEDFETGDPGWTVTGDATTGLWERADPEGTSEGIETVQPEDDHTPAPGSSAWVTGPLAGASLGHHDVDGGETVLSSPVYDLTGMNLPRASYWRWYSTGIGNPNTDFWSVEISSNGGGSWSVVENTDQPSYGWIPIDVGIDSLITPTEQVAFRFTARDTGAGSIIEAAVDDFLIYDLDTMTGTSAPTVGTRGETLVLGRSFPNPFLAGQRTVVPFALPFRGRVEAVIYDVAGRRVATIADGQYRAGAHHLEWDGRIASGRPAPAGLYFLKVRSSRGERARKLLVLR